MIHSSKKIGSVQRAIDILNLFKTRSPELGTTEIARALGLHKSTAASLVYTLEANGFLSQNASTRKYRLGFKVVERAFAMLDQIEVRQIAYPHLRALRDEWNESVNLAILDGFEVVYVERMLGTKALSMRSEVGRREPVHSTALGKALIACLPDEKVRELVKRCGLPAMTPKTITDPERLLAELDQVREQGYAVDDEENEIGGRCVGVPIFDHTGQAAAAVSISAPTARLPLSGVPQAGAMVLKTAKAISRELGYLPRAF